MRLALRGIVAAILLAQASAHAAEQPVISMSSEPTGLVVRSQRTGRKITPGIEIGPSGLVRVRRYDGSEATKHIDRRVVDRLLHKLERSRFYVVSQESVDAELVKSGLTERIVVTDCPWWTVRTRVASRTHVVRFYALYEAAERFPKSRQLKTLTRAIENIYSSVGDRL